MDAALTFGETVRASLLEALFTAVFVSLGAGSVLWWFQSREARRQASLAEERSRDERKQSEAHDWRQAEREREFQTRVALRETYAQLLVAQRHSRQCSMALTTSAERRLPAAIEAHDNFIDAYHKLSLDADSSMWEDLKALRRALDLLLYFSQKGDATRCQELFKAARTARQNLEQSFRKRLGHVPLMDAKTVSGLGGWGKVRDETSGTFLVGERVDPNASAS